MKKRSKKAVAMALSLSLLGNAAITLTMPIAAFADEITYLTDVYGAQWPIQNSRFVDDDTADEFDRVAQEHFEALMSDYVIPKSILSDRLRALILVSASSKYAASGKLGELGGQITTGDTVFRRGFPRWEALVMTGTGKCWDTASFVNHSLDYIGVENRVRTAPDVDISLNHINNIIKVDGSYFVLDGTGHTVSRDPAPLTLYSGTADIVALDLPYLRGRVRDSASGSYNVSITSYEGFGEEFVTVPAYMPIKTNAAQTYGQRVNGSLEWPGWGAFNVENRPVTSLSAFAFTTGGGVGDIKVLSLPSTLTTIHAKAFDGLTNLERFEVDPANTVYESRDGVLYKKDGTLVATPAKWRASGGSEGGSEAGAGGETQDGTKPTDPANPSDPGTADEPSSPGTGLPTMSQPGIHTEDNGKLYWTDDVDGASPKTGWQVCKFDNSYKGTYYFDPETGAAVAGWKEIDGKTYFFDRKTFKMRTGWVKDAGSWFYFKADGTQKTGWQKSGGSWYYFDPKTGKMVSNKWIKSGSDWYYFGSNGIMYANKGLWAGGNFYWFKASSGKMAKSERVYGYWFSKNGVRVLGV